MHRPVAPMIDVTPLIHAKDATMAQRTVKSGTPIAKEVGNSRGLWNRETHVRHRDYSPTVGRFIERDPIGFEAGDNNWYRFVANGPTGKTDSFGLTEGIPIPSGGTIHIDGEAMGTATPHVQYGVAPNQTKIQIPATMTNVDDLTTLPGINKSLIKKLLKNPYIYQKLQHQLNNARGKCGLAGIVLTIVLAAPEVAQAGQEGGLTGAASAAGNVAVGTAVAAGESVVVGGAIMGGASLAGTSVTTGAGVAYVGIGGAATVGWAATLTGGVGFGVGYGIGRIPWGSHTIHEHMGEGMYWVGHGVYVGGAAVGNAASSAWNWITDW